MLVLWRFRYHEGWRQIRQETDGGRGPIPSACPTADSGELKQSRLLRTLHESQAQGAAFEKGLSTTDSPFEQIGGFGAMDGQAHSGEGAVTMPCTSSDRLPDLRV